MTCSRNFRRVLQAGCLGLIGALTVVGCGGSENKPTNPDATPPDGGLTGKANLTANPTTVPLGSVDVGKTSTPATVKITNNGTAASTVTVTPSGVGISASGCAGSLAIGGSCDVTITATPTAVGSIVGTVAVAAANGNTVSISVTGTAGLAGAFTVAPATIPLGDLVVGATVPVSVTVTATAAITAGLTTGVQGGDLVVNTTGSTCTGALAAGASCVVAATFTATAAGSPTNDAIVVSQGGVVKSVPVTANVLTPAKLAATPAKADLAAVPGSSSANLDINIGNIGGMTTGQLAVAITGTSFKIVSEACSVVTLAASKYCTVTVAYQPAAAVTVAETGALTVTDKAVGGSVATVALTGTPNISGLTIAGGPALGSVAPGATGAEVVFTVTNTAATPTGSLTAAVNSPLVAISSNTCATKATLNKGDTCTVGLKLAPSAATTAQAVSGLLTVASAAGGSVSASFTGTVVTGPKLSATPSSVSFGSIPVNQQSAVQTVTIKNEGATATGTLAAALSGAGAAQVAITANTCTGSLAAAQTCSVSVQYSPTDITGVNGTISVTDGTTSVAVVMVGTGLTPTGLVVTADPNASPVVPVATIPFNKAVVGYAKTSQAYYVLATATATSDSGAIAAAITGANAADFAITTNGCTTSLQPSASCPLTLSFTPGGVGARAAVLTVTGAKGGVWTVQLTGTGLALVSLVALDATTTPATTGLDFGQAPNGTAGKYLHYRVIVRGATSAAATDTTSAVTLANPGTPADFRNVDYDGETVTASLVNRCDAKGLKFIATTGLPAGTTLNWVTDATTPDATGFWSCDFYIQFYPQSGKSATPKTATINASATAGGSDSLALSGIATGPLVFDPSSHDFSNVAPGQASAAGTLTLVNKGAAGVNQGPFTVALGGTNAADFGIVVDGCTPKATITPTTAAVGPYAPASSCTISVVFAPAAAGAKTATLTVTAASGETASATLTGSAATAASVTVTPAGATADTAVDFGSIAQADVGAWTSFTIKNPAGAPVSGKLTYAVAVTGGTPAGDFELYTLVTAGVAAYPAGFCGDVNTKQLAADESCIVQVRFKPSNGAAPGARTGTLVVNNGAQVLPTVYLKGKALPQLTLTGAVITLVGTAQTQTVDFGNVATGAVSASKTFTITNNGAASLTLSATALVAPFALAQNATSCTTGTVLAGKGTCTVSMVYTGTTPSNPVAPTTGSITYSNGTANVEAPLALTGTSVKAAQLALYGFGDGDTVDLGSVPLTTQTGTLTVWFQNIGGVDATGIDTSWTLVVPAGNTDFSVVTENKGTCFNLGGTLAAGAICSVNVRATPSGSAGLRTATLNFFGTALAPATLNVQARGVVGSQSVFANVKGATNSFASFPTTSITSATGSKLYFVLTNNLAGVTLNLGGAAFAGGDIGLLAGLGRPADFILAKETDGTGTACGATLTPAASCTFSIAFKPTTWVDTDTLYRWAAVQLLNHQIAAVDPNLLGLFGTVQKPAKLKLSAVSAGGVKVTGAAVDFGQILQGQTPSLVFTIANTGDEPTAGAVSAKITGAATYAAVSSSTCPATALQPGATCTATVASQLTSTLGAQAGLSIQAVDTPAGTTVDSDEVFTLAATVVNPATLVLAPAATTFGAPGTIAGATGGSINITVTNGATGDAASTRQDSGKLTVTLSNSTDFVVDTNAANSTCLAADGTYQAVPGATGVAGANTCVISIIFKPQTAGAKTTSISVSATPGGTPPVVTLTGTGLADLSIGPASTAAAPVALAGSPLSATFTVTNVGASATGALRSTLGGTNAASFVITADSCFAQSVAAAGTCDVTVQFVGTVSATTAATATLTVTDTTANNTATAYMKAGGP